MFDLHILQVALSFCSHGTSTNVTLIFTSIAGQCGRDTTSSNFPMFASSKGVVLYLLSPKKRLCGNSFPVVYMEAGIGSGLADAGPCCTVWQCRLERSYITSHESRRSCIMKGNIGECVKRCGLLDPRWANLYLTTFLSLSPVSAFVSSDKHFSGYLTG